MPTKCKPEPSSAVAEHRLRLRARGLQRLEVQVRGEDAPLVRAWPQPWPIPRGRPRHARCCEGASPRRPPAAWRASSPRHPSTASIWSGPATPVAPSTCDLVDRHQRDLRGPERAALPPRRRRVVGGSPRPRPVPQRAHAGRDPQGDKAVRPRDSTKAAALDAWLTEIADAFGPRVLGVDIAVAEAWGCISAARSVLVVDALLAATAGVHGLVLVTRNVADVDGLGVRVLDLFAAAAD